MSVSQWIEEAIAGLPNGCILITELDQANLRWANNALTTNGQMHSRTATAINFAEGGDAVKTAQVASAADLLALVRAVGGHDPADGEPETQTIKAASIDEMVDLITESGFRSPSPEDLAEFSLPAVAGGITVFDEFAQELGAGFAAAKERGALLYGFAEHQLRTQWLATTSGIRRRAVVPTGRLELNAKDTAGTNSAWYGQFTTDFADISLPGALAELWKRLGWGENRIELPAGRYEAVMPPSAVADMLIYAYWTMNGRDAREGRNVYAAENGTTLVGTKLAQLPIDLWSDPSYPGFSCPDFAFVSFNDPGIASVRDNGKPVGREDWIASGVLNQLIETDSAEHRLAFPTDNLICEAGSTTSLDEMIASTKRGLLLTCLWYIREVTPETLLLTGLTRDGVYLIEDGQVVGAVNNFRFNESPISLLARATEASASEVTLCREWNDYFQMTRMPALRIPDFNMSTVSKAQ